MKKVLILLSGLLLAGSLLTGCSGVPTYTDDTVPIDARVNQEFVIAVSIDPIGAYFWEHDFDESKLELVASVCVLCSIETVSDFGIYGSHNTFQYRALEPGVTEIRMIHRQWQGTDILEQKAFTVNIK